MQPDKKQKILYFVTKGVWGGAQKYVYSLATNLPKDRFDVVVVCGEGKILKEKLESVRIKTIEIENLKRDISIISEIKSFWKIYKIIKEEKPDVIHLNSPKASGIGSVAGRLLGVPKIIQTIHGFSFNEDRSLLWKTFTKIFSWITILLCDKNIVIAKKEEIQAMTMPIVSKKKIELIRNGVEKIDFLEKEVARKILSDSISNPIQSSIWIGTLSELHKNKGLEYIIKAVVEIQKPFVFIVFGEGEERNNLEKLVEKYGLNQRFFMFGFKDNANQYLKAFDIFTLTSKKEGLPYTILEAGLANLPVIASRVGGIPDIIEDEKTGILVEKGNIEEIKEGIETLINNQTMRFELGKNLKNKVEREFSMERMLAKTTLLYF